MSVDCTEVEGACKGGALARLCRNPSLLTPSEMLAPAAPTKAGVSGVMELERIRFLGLVAGTSVTRIGGHLPYPFRCVTVAFAYD
jgi:hypothetical protein